jgi:Na+/proline symporter
MTLLGINVWDLFTLGVYLLGITAIGVMTARKVKDTADFFIAGRRFGKVFMVFFAFGAGTDGNQAVTVASKTYVSGLSGIWYQWLWLFATPFYWIIAPFFRRMRALTTGDFFEHRYGAGTDALYAVMGVLQLTVHIGTLLIGSGAVIEAVSGGTVQREFAIPVMTLLFLIYGIAGGLSAAIVTDFIQGILTIVLSFILLPFALNAVGGFAGLHQHITDPGMFSLVAPGEINLFHITIFAVNALVGIVTQPHIMGVCAAGRTELDGRVGFAIGNLMKRFCTVAWMLTGLCGVVLYQNLRGREADMVYGLMAADLLPKIMPGLVGIFLAALLASVMSSCDAAMVSCSGLFTQNVYRRYLVSAKPDKHYVLVGRIASVFIVMAGLSFAFLLKEVITAFETFMMLQAMMGAAWWMGLFWRRTTPAAVWASTLAAFGAFLFMKLPVFGFNAWAVENLPEFMVWNGAFRTAWLMFTYLVIGFGSCILVSLFTRRAPEQKLSRFYDCIHTPVVPGERVTAPFTLPEGSTPLPPRKLINHPDIEIPFPTLLGLGGFVALWVSVFLLIGFVYWLAGVGS